MKKLQLGLIFFAAFAIAAPAIAQVIEPDGKPVTFEGMLSDSLQKTWMGAVGVRQLALAEQREVDLAEEALRSCDGCAQEPELERNLAKLKADREANHQTVDIIALKGGASMAELKLLRWLLDPENREWKEVQAANRLHDLIANFCYVVGEKDEDKQLDCKAAISPDLIIKGNKAAKGECFAKAAAKYNVDFSLAKTDKEFYHQHREAYSEVYQCLDTAGPTNIMLQEIKRRCGKAIPIQRFEEFTNECNPVPGSPDDSSWVMESKGYALEFGPERSPEAVRWYRMAADLNNATAQYLYGSALERGFGVNQDFPKARRYYEKSALRHNGDAAFALAKMYLEGYGVSSDEAEGVRWLQVGAKFLGLAKYDKTLAIKDLAKPCESKDARIADEAKSLLRTIGSECPTLPAR